MPGNAASASSPPSSDTVVLKTMAPAPSPNKIQLLRSSQSIHRLKASAPTTKAFFIVPLSKNCPAVTVENKNPEHAAVKSNATALVAPTDAATDVASPNKSSGEDVATMTKSMSSGSTPDISSAPIAAPIANDLIVSGSSPSSKVSSLCSKRRRSDMPVRVRIHSSSVSTIFSRSEFVTTVLGAALPIPMARQFSLPPHVALNLVVDFCKSAVLLLDDDGDAMNAVGAWKPNTDDALGCRNRNDAIADTINFMIFFCFFSSYRCLGTDFM
mmetsp:Transcript_31915/g.46965  ORF Transcript_31915/g.46965 Transcript_31915/m.46965 type:complete len:270 (+) Transcript_31915:674-1483(+)